MIIGMGALQINTLLDGLIASWPVLVGATISLPFAGTLDYPLDEASNATLFFASRLYQFPLGVFGIALATAVFPLLARQARARRATSTSPSATGCASRSSSGSRRHSGWRSSAATSRASSTGAGCSTTRARAACVAS